MKEFKVLGIIPARSGSKGVPNKNIIKICGKPLMNYSIEVALTSNLITDLCLTSDSKKYLNIGKDAGCKNLILRDDSLSNDTAKSIDVVKDALEKMSKQNNKNYDAVLLLQPTAPLRTKDDIDKSINILRNNDLVDSVISVVRTMSHHPYLIKKIENGFLKPFFFEEREGTRRQDYSPQAYLRNGSIYCTRSSTIINNSSLWGNKIIPLVMSDQSSINVDSLIDLKILKEILQERKCVD